MAAAPPRDTTRRVMVFTQRRRFGNVDSSASADMSAPVEMVSAKPRYWIFLSSRLATRAETGM